MGNDSAKLYTSHLQAQQFNHSNPHLSYNPQFIPPTLAPPSVKPATRNLSFLSPRKQKDLTHSANLLTQSTFRHNPHNTSLTIDPTFQQLQTSRLNLQRTNPLTDSTHLTKSQTLPLSARPQPKPLPPALKKQHQKPIQKIFKLDPYLELIDDIRVSLRQARDKILSTMKPMITKEIKDMYLTISLQKTNKFNDKDKVLFILAQKNHYLSLLDKLQDYYIKINQIVGKLRRHDKLPAKELEQMNFSKESIVRLMTNIEKDLPGKSWRVVLQQPESKLYQLVVARATKEEKVLKEFEELEKAEEPGDIENCLESSVMLVSKTRRVGSPTGNENYHFNTTESKIKGNPTLVDTSLNQINTTKSEIKGYAEENIPLVKKNSGGQFPELIPRVQEQVRQTRYPFGEVNRF